MSRYSLEEFVSQTSERDHGEGFFELESERMLEVNLDTTTTRHARTNRSLAHGSCSLRSKFMDDWWKCSGR